MKARVRRQPSRFFDVDESERGRGLGVLRFLGGFAFAFARVNFDESGASPQAE
ncbi:MAG: hypothetical protein ABI183_17625 [Polyangiaceae bacterium]